jgi:hypothetical protein
MIPKCPPFLIEKSRNTTFLAFLRAIALLPLPGTPASVRVVTSRGSPPVSTFTVSPRSFR